MNQSNDVVMREYVLPGCVAGCRWRGEDIHRRRDAYDERRGNCYRVHEIEPVCAQSQARSEFRADVYQRANEAADAADDKCTTVYGKVRARKRAWDEATKPYVKGPCPFFEAKEK